MRQEHKIQACALILLIQDNKIFLLKRLKTGWLDGFYAIPGGCLEANESITQACIREAYEELGVKIAKADLNFLNVSHLKISTKDYFVFSFFANKWQGEPVNKESDKHADGFWFELDKLPQDIIPAALEVIYAYRNKIYFFESNW